jgi:uncharacterized membrane protein AbrB (regulator of aidB expression)
MPLIRLLCIIAVVAVVAWLLVTLVPMPYPFGTIIVAVAVLGCLFYALRSLGVSDGGGGL